MASEPKKRRTEEIPTEDVEKNLLHAALDLCFYRNESSVTLTPLKKEYCNAISSICTSFSKAFFETKPYDDGFMFGDVFQNGLSTLKEKEAPKDKPIQLVLNKLMDFIKEGKHVI